MSDNKTNDIQSVPVKGSEFPLYIETESGDIAIEGLPVASRPDLPEGAVPRTSSLMEVVDSLAMMKQNIGLIALQVQEAFADNKPEEWGVEFNIGFKGKAAIPFIAQGEASSALKVTAKWKKSE